MSWLVIINVILYAGFGFPMVFDGSIFEAIISGDWGMSDDSYADEDEDEETIAEDGEIDPIQYVDLEEL